MAAQNIFSRTYSLELKLIIFVVLACFLLFADRKSQYTNKFRFTISTLISPIQYVATVPKKTLDYLSSFISSKKQLLVENEHLKIQHLLDAQKLQAMEHLQEENIRLRSLLDSPKTNVIKRMVTEVVAVTSDPYNQNILINKGLVDNVYEGQAVMDAKGVVGQVIDVGSATSRVLLIVDNIHSLSVRVLRNDVSAILTGSGQLDRLTLSHIPHSTDINPGDTLVTSGLGGRFPEGYPVAQVLQVDRNQNQTFAQVEATPIADLDRLRYLLLIWTQADQQQNQG